MKNNKKILFAAGISSAMILGFLSGQIFFTQQDTEDSVIRAMTPETPRKIAMPALQQANGESFDMASLTGKWSLLFFGYTNCPDICPTTLMTVAAAKKKFEQEDEVFPQVVFISVDPERDDVSMLADYVSYFDKDFIGATGEENLLRSITIQMNSSFMVEPSENASRYMVGHSLNLILINPDVELVAILRAPHTVKSILAAVQHFQYN